MRNTSAIVLFAGTAHPVLAGAVAERLGVRLGSRTLEHFPDGELHVELRESVRQQDVYLLQPAGPPVGENLLELLLLADACRRAGAAQITAVVPYLGYARQDRRAHGREPVGARVIADLMGAGGLGRVVAVDLHSSAVEGMFPIPVEHLHAMPLLSEALRPHMPDNAVVVSPDLGGLKLAERYARHFEFPMAIVHKTRISGSQVSAHGVVGEVRGRAAVLVDDMISTGGTIEAAARALLAAGCDAQGLTVVATHGLFVGPAVERLRGLPLRRIVVTDSLAHAPGLPLPLHVVGLAPLLGMAIERLHGGESLSGLIAHR